VTSKSPQIEVTVMVEAAVVRFRRTECLMWHFDPRQDFEKDLFTLVDTDHHSLVVLDFGNPDIKWLSGAFQLILVGLHRRLSKANGVLKLCNVPEAIMEQFQANQLIKVFKIYPNLEAALKSDA
jgi:anti-anti-sigma regulatory factor